MAHASVFKCTIAFMALATLGACGGFGFGPPTGQSAEERAGANVPGSIETNTENTIWSIFNRKNTDTSVSVNKYLWSASLEVLNFLPIQSIDPYTGVIVTGYGTPPGGSQSYRATVLIDDPALDGRSLNIALQTRGGRMVNKATSRAVEDAILSRAREMRIADNKY
ncbi:DUF3576 domain-containing protein [uncultured Sulfitobacter sp.]|jgi:hypothetical protein|uniref:DUF3576 domain-containing protein n=1 Tax=uncultured Sulfitobacter sp. TaxID=191468 RepID=UPI0030F7E9E3